MKKRGNGEKRAESTECALFWYGRGAYFGIGKNGVIASLCFFC